MKTATLLLFFASISPAQEMPRWNKVWMASSATLMAAQVADIASSYGNVGREANPVFGDTFTAKDAALKLGITGGFVVAQYFVIRRFPKSKAAKVFSVVNFGAAGATGVVAARNWRQR